VIRERLREEIELDRIAVQHFGSSAIRTGHVAKAWKLIELLCFSGTDRDWRRALREGHPWALEAMKYMASLSVDEIKHWPPYQGGLLHPRARVISNFYQIMCRARDADRTTPPGSPPPKKAAPKKVSPPRRQAEVGL
jgi:hypothetical protein